MLYLNSVRVAPGVRSALAVACGVVLSMGQAAWAEEGSVAPVIVSASRMPQLLQNAPIGATVITAEQIQRSGVADANEAIRKLGGVAAKSDLNNGRENALDLRGFGVTADQNLVVMVDGIRLSENELVTARLTSIPLDMIDRIEIIRGGASVLWGEGASGGAINIILKRTAANMFKGKVSGAVETQGGHEVQASGRWGWGSTNFDASIKGLRSDGFRENSTYAQDVVSVGLQWSDGGWEARARVIQEDQNAGLPGGLWYGRYLADRRATATPDDFASTRETRYMTSLAYKQGAWTGQVDLGQRTRDATFDNVSYFSKTNSSRTQSQISPRVAYADSIGAVDLKAVVGLDWQGWDFEQAGSFISEVGSQENRAGYVQTEISLPTQTRLSVGWREEHIRKQGDYPGDGFYPAANYDRRDKVHAGEFGVSQTLVPGWDLYGRLASSYRLPNVDENRVTPLGEPLRPQKNSDKEVGIKWLDGGNSFTARYFHQDTRDEIIYVSSIGFTGANANLDPTRRRGVEFEGRWSPAKNLTLSATWQQLTAKFRSGPNAGNELVMVAPHTGTARASYRFDDHNSVDVGMQFMASTRTAIDATNTCDKRVPSSTLLDGRYAWSDRFWTIALSGTNLADKKGYNYDYSCNALYVYPYAGRAVKLSISRQF